MHIKNTILICCLFSLTLACQNQSKYDQIVKRELAKGVRNDSLFLGYSLGMTTDEFYNYSWELNKKHLVREGSENRSVRYDLNEELPHPATMNFYPDFQDGIVYRMKVVFSYDGWAPWNDNLGADSLIFDVKELMEKWYGRGFFKMEKSTQNPSFVKIDGNREILIFKADEIAVNVFFTDLTAIRENNNTTE